MRMSSGSILLLAFLALPAFAAQYTVGVYECGAVAVCFAPNPITIRAGDTVAFLPDSDFWPAFAAPHSVAADDGSFRCARGCDDDGGSGAPAPGDVAWGFVRVFDKPGVVQYHDVQSGTKGVIVVLGGPGSLVVEYFNPALGTYFITSDVGEQAFLDIGGNGGWQRTGQTFKSGGPAAACRFAGNPYPIQHPKGPNSHFYASNPAECSDLKSRFDVFTKSWLYESDDFRTTLPGASDCTPSLTPVYRAYNDGFVRGIDSNHRITTDLDAYNAQIAAGWIGEGVVMCAPQ